MIFIKNQNKNGKRLIEILVLKIDITKRVYFVAKNWLTHKREFKTNAINIFIKVNTKQVKINNVLLLNIQLRKC